MKKPYLVPALLFASLLAARAAENISVIDTAITTGTPSTTDGNTYNNDVRRVTSVSTATASYVLAAGADNVYVRRNTVNANQSSAWYVADGNNLAGVAQPTYDEMLVTNSVYLGTDNTFANGTDSNTGNVERLDFTWDTAITASSTLGFGVFDRGVVAAHDSFAIAAITAVDSQGNPTAYGSLFRVNAGWGGATNGFGDQSYRIFRYGNGDNLSTATSVGAVGPQQGIGGILITTADLGLIDGTEIYGYSLMANDVTPTNSSDLVDFTNAAVFPTTTSNATGGVDLASLNGFQLQAIPEPSTWVLFLLGAPLAGLAWRRSARTRRSA